MKVIISACLLGVRCRYDGGDSRNELAIKQKETDELIPVCPEEAGGLPTPRPPAEIVGGDGEDVLNGKAKVMTVDGTDVTAAYLKGRTSRLTGCAITRCNAGDSQSKESVLRMRRHLRRHFLRAHSQPVTA